MIFDLDVCMCVMDLTKPSLFLLLHHIGLDKVSSQVIEGIIGLPLLQPPLDLCSLEHSTMGCDPDRIIGRQVDDHGIDPMPCRTPQWWVGSWAGHMNLCLTILYGLMKCWLNILFM